MISQTTNASGSNPSLITAGLPSDSIITSRLIHPSMNHQLNQNRATDSPSHRTISDTYLNLSRKDINDVMTALHTLAQCVQDDINDNESSHHLTMLYSKNSSQINSSSHHYYHPQYSIRPKRHSDRCLNHHHAIKRMYLYPVEDFQHDLYDMKRKKLRSHQKYFNHHNPSTYPSYTSNALLYTSTIQPREVNHYPQQRQSIVKTPSEDQSMKNNLSSSIPLSSYILDKLVYINQKEPITSIQILPQQAKTLQILQNNQMQSFMSIDSLSIFNQQKRNRDQIFSMGDQLNFNKTDVATQWSLQITKPNLIKSENTIIEMDIQKSENQEESEVCVLRTNSIILTELSQSISTIMTDNSTDNVLILPNTESVANNSSSLNDLSNVKLNTDLNEMCLEKSTLMLNDEHELTKTETERFLTTLNIPTCKCLQTENAALKQQSIDENITYISLDNDSSTNSSSSKKKKKTKQISIKLASKRPRRRISKPSKNNQTIRRSRPRRPQAIIPSYKTTDPKEDSSFDFFDIDTTFSDAYDRLFTDTTTTSEKSL